MAISPSLAAFKKACDDLGAVLVSLGFKYKKSKREAVRQGGLFEHTVSFGTSRSINSLPGHVHLEVRATAWSEALGEYRRSAGIRLPINEAALFDTTIENLFRPAPPYLRYDIGDVDTRDEVIAGITRVIRTEVVRVFELVENPDLLRRTLDSEPIPCLVPEAVRDYFACFGTDTAITNV